MKTPRIVATSAALVGMIATIAAVVLIVAQYRWSVAEQSVITQDLAGTIGHKVEDQLGTIDYVLQVAGDEIRRQQAAGQATYTSVTDFLSRQQDRFPEIDLLRATNDRGETIYGRGVDPAQRASLAQRDYYRQLRDDASLGMIIAEPIVGRISQKWIWLMARRLTEPDGGFAGIVYASIFIDDLAGYFARYPLAPGSTIALLDAAMRVVASATFEAGPPLPIGEVRASAAVREALASGRPAGVFFDRDSPDDGITRIFAYQRSAKYGFTLLVGIPQSQVVGVWLRQSWVVAALLLTFLAALVLATRLVRRKLHDVSRAHTQEVRDAEQVLLGTLIRSLPSLIWLKDPGGRYLACNREFERFFGKTAKDIVGRTDYDFLPREAADSFRHHDSAALAADKPTINEEWVTYAEDGHRALLSTTKAPLRAADGTLIGVLGISHDITQRKEVEAELVAAKAAAEAASVAKTRFLAAMSHEIRTPMNGILGVAQLLLAPDVGEDERMEYIRTIMNSGRTLLTLLNDILDLSKIEAGKLNLEYRVFAPAQVVEEICTLFSSNAEAKGLWLRGSWQGDPKCRLRADPYRIRQMLTNLVANAIKFTEHGGVEIDARMVASGSDSLELEFAVSDTGIGIADDDQEGLFTPFVQADGSITRKYGGSGLGLSIVRSLAMSMGGDVGLTSEPGRGSRFWFRIRAEPVVTAEDSRQHERTGARADPPGVRLRDEAGAVPPVLPASGVTAGSTVLVVDDNPMNRMVIERMLVRGGASVVHAENGQQALDLLRGDPARFDVVLMDIQMPVLDGLSATRAIRADPALAALPVIAVTAGVFADERAATEAAGVDGILAKPVDMRQLLGALEQARQLAARRAAVGD